MVCRAHFLYHLMQRESELAADWWERMCDQQDPYGVLIPRHAVREAVD
jgi:hypothetical protein